MAFGLAVTSFFVWLVLRDVPFSEVAREFARADWQVLLLPAAAAPVALLAALRVAPERAVAMALWVPRPLPRRFSELTERLLRGLSEGLGALRVRRTSWEELDRVAGGPDEGSSR